MINHPEIAVILTGADRSIQWVNEGFTSITGYTMSEVLGKKPAILQGPDTEQEVVQNIRRGLKSEVPFKEAITNYRKNGERYTCKLVIYPIFNHQGELTNFIAFEIDGDKTDDSNLPILQLKKRYSESSLKGTLAANIYLRLCQFLEDEEVFRDPDLSMPEMARILHTNTNYLSQVVNQFSGQNFQQFVNSYRVRAIQKALYKRKSKSGTLEYLAKDYGFRNKSTFYRVFKQHTGQTPSKFVRGNKAS